MAPISEWADLMPDTVTLEPWTGQDGYGEPTYGDPVTYPARVVGKTRLVRTVSGEEKVSTVTVYLGAVPGASPQDRVTLPSRFVPQQPIILAIERIPDETGALYDAVLT